MCSKPMIFTEEEVRSWASRFPTPFHAYDEKSLRLTARRLNQAFDWAPGFLNYYAVKAAPNPHLVNILKEEGMGVDCSSMAELVIAESCGFVGNQIMFTSNDTPAAEFRKAMELGAIINLDDISHIDFLKETTGLPELLSFRYNPGPERVGNVVIGDPKDAKFGLTRDQMFEAYAKCKENGVKRFGMHTMVVSNCLDKIELEETARMMFQLALELKTRLDIQLEFVNLGGGIGLAYRPDDTPIDFEQVGQAVKSLYETMIMKNGLGGMRVVYENGRCVTGPNGYLVTRVIHQKNTYKNYLGVDASIANLMRPAMYNAYHHITVVPCSDAPPNLPSKRSIFLEAADTQDGKTHGVYDVVGSLCENNDKLATNRELGVVRIGDLLVMHDTGAHGHSMGFNYNGKLRSAEYLKRSDGSLVEIRRAETLGDLFATLGCMGLPTRHLGRCKVFLSAALVSVFAIGALIGLSLSSVLTKKRN